MKSAPQQVVLERARSIVAGTAGHIDHGKTALVFALTGTETDRLPEEKSRGITIDLGFATLKLQDSNGRDAEVSIIDVPGHHAFVRNMLAGTGGIDLVMLIIAADEGVKAQTREHLAICSLLGIRQGVIVLTKKDAVAPDRLHAAREESRELVQGTFLQDAETVAVSSMNREGIQDLKAALARVVKQIPERSRDYVPRLPLDRAFTVRGFGTVGTGTLQSGCMRVGDVLEVQPGGRTARVRGVQVHGNPREQADAPSRVALNLAGVEVQDVERGHTLVPAGTLLPTSTVDVELTMVPGLSALRHRAHIRVHAHTSDALARVLLYDLGGLQVDRPVLARLRLQKPMLLVPGDRFVLRVPSPAQTVAGGRVLDAHPLPKLRKSPVHAWLRRIHAASHLMAAKERVLRRGTEGIDLLQLVAETGRTREALARDLVEAIADGSICRPERASANTGTIPNHLIGSEHLERARQRLLKELQNAGGTMLRAELRSRSALRQWVFDLALRRLSETSAVRSDNDHIALSHAQAKLDPRVARLEQMYLDAGLASPIVGELRDKLRVSEKEIHALVTELIRAKRLIRLGADNLFVHCEAVSRLAGELQHHRGESFDVARFKSFTGLTRKHALPLLEHLDRTRVTRNTGGIRVVI